MSVSSTLQIIAIAILPILFAITVHEVAHGWVAKKLGDSTAHRLGRLTLNPLKHIDPVGTVLVPFLMLVTFGFAFGWAKPVPVAFENLRHPKRDMAIVAVAGPMANLLMAFFWAIIGAIGVSLDSSLPWAAVPLKLAGILGVSVNVVLMVLNLIPLPPLDGGRVAVGLLPGPLAWRLARVEPYGFIVIIGLLILSRVSSIDVIGFIVGPISHSITDAILSMAKLS